MTASLQENAFLSKLWNILEDEANTHIVSWDDAGVNFHVFLSKVGALDAVGRRCTCVGGAWRKRVSDSWWE
jgi:hypothetical protein